jgi:hypothetical protein
MFGLNYIKRKLKGRDEDVPANEQFYSPLRIALHSTINVSMVDWLVSLPELNKSMLLPTGNCSVIAIGTVSASRDEIYNIYLVDSDMKEFVLQLFCSPDDKGQGMVLREATVYRDILEEYPQTDDEWTVALHNVGKKAFIMDDLEYERIWGNPSIDKIAMEEFKETVIRMKETIDYTNNYVLYGRELQQATHNPQQELLLVGVEESEESAALVYRIGLPVPVSAVTVQ